MSKPQFPAGVITGENVHKLFQVAREKQFAIPAINVTSSSTIVAVLEAARDAKSPIILQISNGGAASFAGQGIATKQVVDSKGKSKSQVVQEHAVTGACAAARFIRAVAPAYGIPVVLHTDHCAKELLPWLDGMLDADEAYVKGHGEPLFSSHMIDLSALPKEENISTTRKYLERSAKSNLWLEMEIGITGGAEDGQDNSGVKKEKLYTTPEDIWAVYEALSPVSPNFSIAAAFGNVHGVYAPGGVHLSPELLGNHQVYVAKKLQHPENAKPVFFVFHGGSGSSVEEYRTAINFGVVKVNLDTDLQFAYTEGIRDYILKNKDFLMTQVGNPNGADKPNKEYYDPRVWIRKGELTMAARVKKALEDFGATNTLQHFDIKP